MGGGQGQIQQPRVIRMPNPNDPNIIAAAKRLAAGLNQRTGRDSTILSDISKGNVNGSQGMVGR